MLVNEYIEIETTPDYLLELDSKLVTFEQDNCLLTRAIEMLRMWGAYNRYKSHCGHKPLTLFKIINPKCDDILLIQNDIEFVDAALLRLKNSKNSKEQELYRIAELYYKGLDIVDDGFECSLKLTTREIAEYLDMPKSTIADKKKAVDSYIVAELSKINMINY